MGTRKIFFCTIEKTLEYYTKKYNKDNDDETNELNKYFEGTVLENIEMNNTYLPVYYNAWLYDHHDDPLLSLVFTIIKKYGEFVDTEIKESLADKFQTLISSISLSFGNEVAQVSINGEKLAELFNKNNILRNIITAETIRDNVNNIINEILPEKAQRMVIFVDELDRCRPTYAIEMLERIKHYFNDDRLIFVVSVNKEQLIHTISKVYGYGFDSTNYLNKFFDLEVYMPPLNEWAKKTVFSNNYRAEQSFLSRISRALAEHYKLTIRETLIYRQIVDNLPLHEVNNYGLNGQCMSLFIPVMLILSLRDETERKKFIDGNSDILHNLIVDIPQIKKLVEAIGANKENAFESGEKIIIDCYKFIFKEDENVDSYVLYELNRDQKNLYLQLCSNFNSREK